ncbi:hypothetical protein [Vibrio coralliilyticus]|uniref:hypothetical protein n=1 Tax=Vibrio coralliilyticus TaxID=190893 RepID=UPI001560172B|nr:hypothetical protein [Vibrio coralliilyticus]NRF27993.1 hypothetical protein [Vibrio coralliilyticus]
MAAGIPFSYVGMLIGSGSSLIASAAIAGLRTLQESTTPDEFPPFQWKKWSIVVSILAVINIIYGLWIFMV